MTGSAWIASYVLLWVCVLALGGAVVVLLRHIGVLHARLEPQGVHHADQGPVRDVAAPEQDGFDYARREWTLVTFTSPGCVLCAELLPSLRRLEAAEPGLGVVQIDHSTATARRFANWNVHATPYLVAVDARGIVRGGGVANSLEQAEELLASVRSRT